MENGDLLKDIHAKVSKSEQWQIEADKKLEKIMKHVEPGGICEKARSRIGKIATQVGFQWGILVLIVAAIVGWAIKTNAGGG